MACTVPRTVFEFTVDSDETFPERAVSLEGFAKEIRDSAIVAALQRVEMVEGNCCAVFDTDVSVEEEFVLEELMRVHSPSSWDFSTSYLKSLVVETARTFSDEFLTRCSLSTGNLVGFFNLFWTCCGTADEPSTVGEYRIVDEKGEVYGDTLENDRPTLSSMTQSFDLELTGSPKTFSLQWRARSGSHTIKSARLELWRS